MEGVDRDGASTPSPAARIAGGLTILLGLANAVFAVLGLATDLVRFSPTTAGSLLVLGLATVAIGALVWRGSRGAVTLGLVFFGVLLVVQAGDLVAADEPVQGAVARVVVLAILVAALVIARLRPDAGR